jgi:hypothetical protein
LRKKYHQKNCVHTNRPSGRQGKLSSTVTIFHSPSLQSRIYK